MTEMMYFPEQKIAVAVQVNTSVGRSLGKPLSRVIVEVMEVVRNKVRNGSGSDRVSPRSRRQHKANPGRVVRYSLQRRPASFLLYLTLHCHKYIYAEIT